METKSEFIRIASFQFLFHKEIENLHPTLENVMAAFTEIQNGNGHHLRNKVSI